MLHFIVSIMAESSKFDAVMKSVPAWQAYGRGEVYHTKHR
jgi:hypothetical protein